jgi:hypothetical protein
MKNYPPLLKIKKTVLYVQKYVEYVFIFFTSFNIR